MCYYNSLTSKNSSNRTNRTSCNRSLSFNGYIQFLQPESGPISGGNVVMIIGFNLSQVKKVYFNSISVAFQIINNTTVRIVALPKTVNNCVPVYVSFGTFNSNSIYYTYVEPPTITSASPNSGPITGGNVITVTGTQLTDVTTVNFGIISTSNFEVINDTSLNVVVPDLTSAVGTDISVVNTAGTSNSLIYTAVPRPII